MVDKAKLLEKIKNNTLVPEGRPGHREALTAIAEFHAIGELKDLDKKAAASAREQLVHVIADYRRDLRVKRGKRKKHTRG
jgi:hypothetical protein